MPDKNRLVLFLNRKVQVYDFIENKLEFEMNFPSAGSICLEDAMRQTQKQQEIFFLDNDNIVAA